MFKKIIRWLIKTIQAVLIVSLLTILYFLGFGITFLLMMIFNRKVLVDKRKDDSTYWIEAKGYEPDMQDCENQY